MILIKRTAHQDNLMSHFLDEKVICVCSRRPVHFISLKFREDLPNSYIIQGSA